MSPGGRGVVGVHEHLPALERVAGGSLWPPRKLQGKAVNLALTNGSTHEHVTVNFFGDSVGFQREDPPEIGVVSRTSAVSMSRPGSALGPALDFVGGALVGGAIGGAAATGSHEEPKNAGEAIAEAFTVPMDKRADVYGYYTVQAGDTLLKTLEGPSG